MSLPKVILAAAAAPGAGGQGLNLLHMMQGLQGAVDLKVLAYGKHPGFHVREVPRPDWVDKVFRLPLIRRLGDWHAFLSDLHFDQQVTSMLGPCRVFQGVTGQCLSSLGKARSLGARTLLDVVTVHVDDGNPRVIEESLRMGFRARVNRRQLKRQRQEYAAADIIRTMSSHARRTFLDRGFTGDRVFALNPFLDTREFPMATFEDATFRICFVGRLVVGKGFQHVIEACAASELKEAELVLWGGTGERPVSQYLKSQLAMNPRIIQRPVPIRSVGLGEVFGRASVFVHPSLADGFGYSVAEALACGLPVIVTSTTGAADWVEEGVNGFVVEPGDVRALRERVVWCLRNPAKLRDMGRAARQTVERYSLERFRNDYLPQVRALASEGK